MDEILSMFSGPFRATPAETKVGRGQYNEELLRDVLSGLRQPLKSLPSKYLYDRRGVDLFATICNIPEYYLARAELALLRRHAGGIADLVGEGAQLIELGGCSTAKASLLINVLRSPVMYMPIDGSSQHLWSAAMQLQLDHPYVAVRPLHANFAEITALPADEIWTLERAVFLCFGSLLGQWDPIPAAAILRRLAGLARRSVLVIGVDLPKDPALLQAAYNDPHGCHAEFHRNLLLRINRELDGDFDPESFSYAAHYNSTCMRVESYLQSRRKQLVRIAGKAVMFAQGEVIHTQNSYKYSVAQFQRIARRTGFAPLKAWVDNEHSYALHVLSSAGVRH